jgi:hypothetical protein
MDDQLICKEIVMNKHKIHSQMQMFQIMFPKDPLKKRFFFVFLD